METLSIFCALYAEYNLNFYQQTSIILSNLSFPTCIPESPSHIPQRLLLNCKPSPVSDCPPLPLNLLAPDRPSRSCPSPFQSLQFVRPVVSQSFVLSLNEDPCLFSFQNALVFPSPPHHSAPLQTLNRFNALAHTPHPYLTCTLHELPHPPPAELLTPLRVILRVPPNPLNDESLPNAEPLLLPLAFVSGGVVGV